MGTDSGGSGNTLPTNRPAEPSAGRVAIPAGSRSGVVRRHKLDVVGLQFPPVVGVECERPDRLPIPLVHQPVRGVYAEPLAPLPQCGEHQVQPRPFSVSGYS